MTLSKKTCPPRYLTLTLHGMVLKDIESVHHNRDNIFLYINILHIICIKYNNLSIGDNNMCSVQNTVTHGCVISVWRVWGETVN